MQKVQQKGEQNKRSGKVWNNKQIGEKSFNKIIKHSRPTRSKAIIKRK